MWDLAMAPDDTLYIAACGEYSGGMSAWLCSYHHRTDRIEYLADLAEVTGEPNDSGRATQGKIHFSLCVAGDGRIYGATHCTTPPKGDPTWPPITMYTDPVRSFPGAHLFVHDPRGRETRDLGILIPREGIRVMVLDRKRNLFHGTTYPKCHYFVYDLEKRKLTDLGRFGCMHQLALFLDDEGNGYTTDNFGRMIRCEAGGGRLRALNSQLPHAPFRRGEHNIMFQAVPHPRTGRIYGATYDVDARLFCYDPKRDVMRDLGTGYGRQYIPDILSGPYPGGLVFGPDGCLYYVICERDWDGPGTRRGHLIRYDTERETAEDLGVFAVGGAVYSGRSCHGKADRAGNLYFAENSATPPRFAIYRAGKR